MHIFDFPLIKIEVTVFMRKPSKSIEISRSANVIIVFSLEFYSNEWVLAIETKRFMYRQWKKVLNVRIGIKKTTIFALSKAHTIDFNVNNASMCTIYNNEQTKNRIIIKCTNGLQPTEYDINKSIQAFSVCGCVFECSI